MLIQTTKLLRRHLLVLALALTSLQAQTEVPAALTKAKTDLKQAVDSLVETRTQISKEKPEITATFRTHELELIEKRRMVRIARLSKDDRALTLRELQADLTSRRQDANYISGLLKDQALKTSTLAQPGSPRIDVDPQTLAAEITNPARTLESRLTILDTSIDRLEILFGGSTSQGKVADASGEINEGTLIAIGPVGYFLASDQQTGGDITRSKSGSLPHYYAGDAEKIQKLTTGETVTLPLDPTLGNARAMNEVSGGPLDLFRKGGLWIWPILLLAVLSLSFGLAKLLQFARYREPSDAWITAILSALRTGDSDKATQLASQCQHPAGPVMVKLVSVSENSVDLVEESLYEQLMSVQRNATSMLPVIAVTAATSPLLGLLGTVSGMIATFNLITLFGSGDPKPLAGGISEALITTLFGLIVAIPALIVHAFLSRRAQGIVQTTERLGLSFVNGLRAK